MRILKLDQFLKVPKATVFCKYNPCVFNDIRVFTGRSGLDETSRDFVSFSLFDVKASDSDIHFEILLNAEQTGEPFKLDFSATARDGMFEDDQLFAVFDKEDVEGMIKVLQNSLAGKVEITDD